MKTGLISFRRACVSLALLWILAPSGLPPALAQARTDPAAPALSVDPSLAPIFIENAGQFPGGARFQVRGTPQGTIWLAEDAIWLIVIKSPYTRDARSNLDPERARPQLSREPHQAAAIMLTFPGANPHPRLEPFNRLETHISFFTGSDPTKWRADVPAWGGVRYVDLYPGIDLELTGEQGQIVPQLVAQPGADLSAVGLRLEGVEAVAVQSEGGALRLGTAAGEVAWPLLRAEGTTAEVAIESAGPLAFEAAMPFTSAGPHRQSTIEPPRSSMQSLKSPADLLYGTFLGGSGGDTGQGIAVDGSGATYVTGRTTSPNFPATAGAFDTSYNGGMADAFVAKVNAAGSALVYATFLGGYADDYGRGIAVDGNGAAYVAGRTTSPDFPTTPGAFDTSFNSGSDWIEDAFVVKLNPAGSALDYATFLGGSDRDDGFDIAVDGNGAAYVTGRTASSEFPTTPAAFDTSYNGGDNDAIVVKLNPAGSALDYATFLGGSGGELGGGEWGAGIAVDESGAAYVTGNTWSPDFPTTTGAFDTNFNGGLIDAFVVKLNAAGSALDYATFLGGSVNEEGAGIAVDESGAAYVTGNTWSADFPTTTGAFDTSYNGGMADAFVAKLNAAGSALDYATFLGGSGGNEGGGSIAVDGNGAAYVTGGTDSFDFPTTCGARRFSRVQDPFVTKLNPAGSALDYATFLGGSDSEGGGSIAVDGNGAAYVTGGTGSSDFPTTTGAYDTSYNGSGDAFVAKLAMEPGVCVYLPLMLRSS